MLGLVIRNFGMVWLSVWYLGYLYFGIVWLTGSIYSMLGVVSWNYGMLLGILGMLSGI